MRLLNIFTLKFHESIGSQIPPYFILSHRWEGEEITYQHVRDGRNTDARGWVKIRNACDFARRRAREKERHWLQIQIQDGLVIEFAPVEFIWIDTCCIDKRSSAELTEAINSMFKWYEFAIECLVYLNDVESGLNSIPREEAIQRSEWFTRRWTLQELLAPHELVFISSDWKEVLGSRSELVMPISKATGIAVNSLNCARDGLQGLSVARKMSWASRRTCTRQEDEAYCLMGLFNVNMPLLYGEGRKAFQRLQAEIVKTSDDESIFAWWDSDFGMRHSIIEISPGHSVLADSPRAFEHSSDVFPLHFDRDATPYSLTNKGLQIERAISSTDDRIREQHGLRDINGESYLVPWHVKLEDTVAIALNCSSKSSNKQFDIDGDEVATSSRIIIFLLRLPGSLNQYTRVMHDCKEISLLRDTTGENGFNQDAKRTMFIKYPSSYECRAILNLKGKARKDRLRRDRDKPDLGREQMES